VFDLHAAVLQGGLEIGLYFKMAESESESVISKSESEYKSGKNGLGDYMSDLHQIVYA